MFQGKCLKALQIGGGLVVFQQVEKMVFGNGVLIAEHTFIVLDKDLMVGDFIHGQSYTQAMVSDVNIFMNDLDDSHIAEIEIMIPESKRNVIHGSDVVESTKKEIALRFPEEIAEWRSRWIYE